MAHDFCPKEITLQDGTRCELYDTWTDKYFCGLIGVEVCNYLCSDNRLHSRWQLKIFGFPSSPVDGQEYDPNNTRPLPPQHPCLDKIRTGGIECELSEFWEIKFLWGLMRLEICIYKCSDCLFFVSRWRARFFGIPLPWRERAIYPYPI